MPGPSRCHLCTENGALWVRTVPHGESLHLPHDSTCSDIFYLLLDGDIILPT